MVFSGEPEEDFSMETLAETEHFTLWRSADQEGEALFHLEMGNVSIHFTEEEWEELVSLVEQALETLEGGR